MNWLQKALAFVSDLFPPVGGAVYNKATERYQPMVKEAWQEWQDAQQRFNQVSDPGAVDYAVYSLQAAERRYIYLLGKVRQEENPPTDRGGRR